MSVQEQAVAVRQPRASCVSGAVGVAGLCAMPAVQAGVQAAPRVLEEASPHLGAEAEVREDLESLACEFEDQPVVRLRWNARAHQSGSNCPPGPY